MTTSPCVGGITPDMILEIVDFPEPLIPINPTVSPSYTSKQTFLSAKKTVLSYFLARINLLFYQIYFGRGHILWTHV